MMAKFLSAYAKLGRIVDAARATGINRKHHYRWMKASTKAAKLYQRHFHDLHGELCGSMEDEAWRRAVDGVDKPVFYKGEICGYVREFSDRLLLAMMRANIPKYVERQQVEHVNQEELYRDPLEIYGGSRNGNGNGKASGNGNGRVVAGSNGNGRIGGDGANGNGHRSNGSKPRDDDDLF